MVAFINGAVKIFVWILESEFWCMCVIANYHCQHDRNNNHLGDKLLGISVPEFLD